MNYLYDALKIIPFTALAAALLYLPLAVFLHVRKKPYPFLRDLVNYLLTGFMISLIYVTFFWAFTRRVNPDAVRKTGRRQRNSSKSWAASLLPVSRPMWTIW